MVETIPMEDGTQEAASLDPPVQRDNYLSNSLRSNRLSDPTRGAAEELMVSQQTLLESSLNSIPNSSILKKDSI